jgi:argininosuccinate synthase
VPTRINGVPMPLMELIGAAGQLAAAHAIGRIERPGSVIEAPAAVVLHAAHRTLQTRVGAGRDRERVSRQYADMIASGRWADAGRAALDRTVNKWQARVTGDVRLRLFRGEHQILESI